jgi:signal transduction histidine kinase
MPRPVAGNGGGLRSDGFGDADGVRRVAQRVANGDGQRAAGDLRGIPQGLGPVGGLALTSGVEMARRVLAAGDAERDRISKDLHDGAQQRLTALRIGLSLAAEDSRARGDTDASGVLNQFGEELDEAIDELRELVHGVYPVLLTSGGLSPALAAAGRRGSQSVTVLANGVRRYPSGIETAVYFACLAATDNAAKHAGRSEVTVEVCDQADGLRFAVRDTGDGFDLHRTTAGAGIMNMRDRIAAVGGTLTIDSAVGQGTVVEGNVPYP